MVSVAVCTYNRDKFLPDCLESIARQTADRSRFELVIVNNNSTDRTDAICRRFAATHPELSVRYVIEPQQGLSHARNRAIAEARGKYLTFIDDDAIARPDFVSRIIGFFDRNPDAEALGGKVLARFEGPRPDWFNPYSASLFFSHYDKGDQPFQYDGNGYPIGCNMTIRQSFLVQSGGFDPNLGRKGKGGIGAEEKELFQRLQQEGKAYYYDPKVVVQHQIDHFRTQTPYTKKLALGLGQTHRKMYCSNGFSVSCLGIWMITIVKFKAALVLALIYLWRGRPAVSRHLIWYRWMVLLGLAGKGG